MHYRRYAYTSNLVGCNPLLSLVICWHNPYDASDRVLEEVGSAAGDEDDTAVMFEGVDGRLYQVTGMDAAHVVARCFYP
jgi:hypothetical protein